MPPPRGGGREVPCSQVKLLQYNVRKNEVKKKYGEVKSQNLNIICSSHLQ